MTDAQETTTSGDASGPHVHRLQILRVQTLASRGRHKQRRMIVLQGEGKFSPNRHQGDMYSTKYVGDRISQGFHTANLPRLITSLGAEGMLATTNVGSGYGANPLPDNQWTIELSHWFASYLATAQIVIAEYSTGTGDGNVNTYLERPVKEAEWMCGAQIVQREDYYTFNMVGVLLILIGGSSLVIANLMTMFCVQKTWHVGRKDKSGSEPSAWKWYEPLQLQSQVYRAQGLGNWDTTDSVPVLDKDEEIFSAPVFVDSKAKSGRESGNTKWSKEASQFVFDFEIPDHGSTSNLTRTNADWI